MSECRHNEDFTRLDEINKKATGKRIRNFARDRGLTQSQLAKKMKKDPKTISNYYCGVSLPEIQDLFLLSRLLGKSCEDIVVFVGDTEGYQRINDYSVDYGGLDKETAEESFERSERESKLFNSYTQGEAYIRNFEEAGICLLFHSTASQDDVRKRLTDEILFSGGNENSNYTQSLFKYIWRKLREEERAVCKDYIAFLRGERDFEEEKEAWRQINKEYHNLLNKRPKEKLEKVVSYQLVVEDWD